MRQNKSKNKNYLDVLPWTLLTSPCPSIMSVALGAIGQALRGPEMVSGEGPGQSPKYRESLGSM